jgi:membrane-bound lytic murein transglycosylase B
MKIPALPLLTLALFAANAQADYADHDEAPAFIQHMVKQHGFSATDVREILDEAEQQDRVLQAMQRPAEKALPWYKYRRIFINNDRIDRGAEFMRQHQATLRAAEEKYGVPAEIIVAIIGVETWYGRNVGSFRVLDALATLAFDYPRRAPFFRSELEQYLLMCREEKMNPAKPVGSYAGAMGLPQFMPSSFRHYAVDFNGNGRRDLWNETEDVIGSVANYLASRGWRRGEPITAQVRGDTDAAEDFEFSRLEPPVCAWMCRRRRRRRPGCSNWKATMTTNTGSRSRISSSSPPTTAARCTPWPCSSLARRSRPS